MATATIQAVMERTQKRWIIGALLLALLLHAGLLGLLKLYHVAALALPSSHAIDPGPFHLKRVEIDPKTLDANQPDPVAHLPVVEPANTVTDFNLSPQLIEKALRTPLPQLSTPTLPEPNQVISSVGLATGLPLPNSTPATLSADLTQLAPAAVHPGVTSAKLADDLISAAPGSPQAGQPGGATVAGTGTQGQLPGFAELVPNLRTGSEALRNLPEPILLRLPSDVLFDFDSATLKPEADGLLNQATALIVKYPQAAVQVDGYTDSFGAADYDLNLSQARAAAVQAWLTAHLATSGYSVKAQGHGKANYVVSPGGTIDAQQPNRRVEILIQALVPTGRPAPAGI